MVSLLFYYICIYNYVQIFQSIKMVSLLFYYICIVMYEISKYIKYGFTAVLLHMYMHRYKLTKAGPR